MKPKTKRKPIKFESVEDFLKKGGSIEVLPTINDCPRLLYSSGHFGPKDSNRGAQPRKQAENIVLRRKNLK